MTVRVREIDGGYRIDGDWDGLDAANAFLAHLSGRGFSPATVRAYAFDVLNLARFLTERKLAAGRRRCDGGVRLDRLAGSAPAEPGWRRGSGPGGFGGGVDGEPAGGGGAGIVRVSGDDRAAGRQSGALAAARAGAAPLAARAARSSGPGSRPRRRQVGAAAAPASGIVAGQRHRRIRRHAGHASGSGDGVGDAARRAAVGGGARPAVGGCGHGPAAAAGDRQGRQGTSRAGGCGVLHRARRLSAVGAPTRAGDTAVFRGAARTDHRCAGQRGRAAQPVPPPPGDSPVRSGCVRTGCGTPTAPNWPRQGSICSPCGR